MTSQGTIQELDDIVVYNDTYIFIITVQIDPANALLFTYNIADDSWGQTFEINSRYGSFVYRPNPYL